MNTKFVIISHGRTASTVLCHGLNVNPCIRCAYELFGPNSQCEDTSSFQNYVSGSGADYLDSFYSSSMSVAIGFKLFTFHARRNSDQIKAWEYLMSHDDIMCIVLSRRNLLASYLSEQLARFSGKWHPGVSEDNKTLDYKFCVDPIEAERYLYRVYAELKWIREKFSKHHILDIYYEDMKSDFEFVIKTVSDFLGVSYCKTGIQFKSLLGDDIGNNVKNYHDVISHLEHTIFSRNFAD